ncbi:hypothetical protein CTI12_AA032230 [Artemisia annua]|uniref:Uncharacterized protein n=1 Tax=Artemisia annua TaxID=35608 RepID=A0A2U1QGL0_ARTAN|nr:hypothetical protein CTI12_AA032230 [Artemisia annua]
MTSSPTSYQTSFVSENPTAKYQNPKLVGSKLTRNYAFRRKTRLFRVRRKRNNVWRVGDVNVNKKRKDGGGDGENNMNKKKKLKLCGQWKVRDKENGEKTKKKKKKLKFVQHPKLSSTHFLTINPRLPIMDSKTLNSHPISTSASKLLFASPAPSCQPPPFPLRFDHLDHLRSMSCSLPNTHGTSDWLRRLRISRGFPDTDKMGFEDFICSIRKGDSEKMIPKRDLSRVKRKDICEKQQCPKIIVESKNADGNSLLVPLNWNRKRKRTVRTVKKVDQDFKVADPVEEEEKGQLDLLGCSQTEFTVIDTSLPSWKFEKMLHRRKNAWEVGDKKGKGSKRRDGKKSLNENSEMKLRVDKGKTMVRSKCAQGHDQGKAMASTSEKKQDNCSQVQEKRHVILSHSTYFSDKYMTVGKTKVLKKQIEGGSSVILIKSIPITNKKDMSGISKSCVKLQK